MVRVDQDQVRSRPQSRYAPLRGEHHECNEPIRVHVRVKVRGEIVDNDSPRRPRPDAGVPRGAGKARNQRDGKTVVSLCNLIDRVRQRKPRREVPGTAGGSRIGRFGTRTATSNLREKPATAPRSQHNQLANWT